MKARGIVGVDVHKPGKPFCAEMGGLSVLLGFIGASILSFFLLRNPSFRLICAFLTILFVGFVGVVDDLFSLRQRHKPLLAALASAPLILANVSREEIWFPFFGSIYFGHLYLVFIPLGVATASNLTNMLAGFNGLEAGTGAMTCFALGSFCIILGRWDAALLAFPLSAAFIAFLKYNWYPAKVFPGDTGTLISGAAIASISILGGVEFPAILMMTPAAIDFTLKMFSRSPFSHRRIFGNTQVRGDRTLVPPPYPSLCHIFMRIAQLNERDLVLALLLMEALYCILGIFLTTSVR